MFCKNCGAELPDEANFCWKCGLPQRDDVQIAVPHYEVCEITYRITKKATPFFGGGRFRFCAISVGPEGKYVVAETEELPGEGDDGDPPNHVSNYRNWKRACNELERLSGELVKDGWKYAGSCGSGYWERRFRRQIRE